MASEESRGTYPRALRPKEKDLLDFVLPSESAGYGRYRRFIAETQVIGQGRRGAGNLVLGYEPDTPDNVSPLAPVIAYGMVEGTREVYSVTVREIIADQIDVEIVSSSGGEVPEYFEEKRRWTYSTWRPGQPSPANGGAVREVVIEQNLVLALSRDEKRLWVSDGVSGMNLLIPITNYYNELMLLKKIRDPEVALMSHSLFTEMEKYTDHDLRTTFMAYNNLKPKVEVNTHTMPGQERGLSAILKKLFSRVSP